MPFYHTGALLASLGRMKNFRPVVIHATRALALSALLIHVANAAVTPDPSPSSSPCPDCTQPTKNVSFTLACSYKNSNNPTGYKDCEVSSTFTKAVTLDGGEIVDDSVLGNNPALVVTCDGVVVYNDSGHRSTGLLGSTIQGESGPFPAFTLDRGELHDGSHVAGSYLTVDTGNNSFLTTRGSCQILASP